MGSSDCLRAAERLAAALGEYFRRRGPSTLGYVRITGQPEVKVALRAIALHFRGDEDFPYLRDVLASLDAGRLFEYLREKLGWRLVSLEGEEYLSIPSDQYARCVDMPSDSFVRLLEAYCSST